MATSKKAKKDKGGSTTAATANKNIASSKAGEIKNTPQSSLPVSSNQTRTNPWMNFITFSTLSSSSTPLLSSPDDGKEKIKLNASSFPELPDCMIWIRICIGTLYGMSLAYRNIREGAGAFLLGSAMITFLPHIYVEHIMHVNVDSYSGKSLLFAGVVNAMSIMTLVWILLHTHWNAGEEEGTLISMYLSQTIFDNMGMEGSEVDNKNYDIVGGGDRGGNAANDGTAQSEF